MARTELGRGERVVLAGHLDTVPPADNLPSRREGDVLRGLGSADMKGGLAVMLRLAAAGVAPARDVTYVFYDGEEVEAERNGLLRLSRTHPDWLAADFAVLLEPTDAIVEGGCQGTMRVEVTVPGVRAHSARSWMGVNAIHEAAHVLDRLRAYEPRRPVVDGLEFREGLNAVGIAGGVAGNVIPGECVVTVNFRFAPDRSEQEAEHHLREVFEGFERDVSPTAPRGRVRVSTTRPLRRSPPRSAGRRAPSTAGRTSRASRCSACPRSTTDRVTLTSPTPRGSGCRCSSSPSASNVWRRGCWA